MYKTALKLLHRINEAGFVSYIVGGYPRDMYLGRDSLDVDICTNATPMDIKTILSDVVLPSEQYGSVTVIINKVRFEITTFRKDIKYANNRLPVKIKYIDTLFDDLKRRDFTINTLCIDEVGNTIDLLDSKKDIDNKIIRMVGSPKIRLKEDVLRILRAIRFATILNFKIDDELKKWIKKYGHLLKKLSYNRKKEELDKIFSSTNAAYGITLLNELGLDKHLELSMSSKFVVTSFSISIWSQLGVLNIYPFNNIEKETIIKINELMNLDLLDNMVLYTYGSYYTSLCGEIKGIERKDIVGKYNELVIKSRREIAISSSDICEVLGKTPGPFLKDVLNDLESSIVTNKLDNNRELLIEYVKKNYI